MDTDERQLHSSVCIGGQLYFSLCPLGSLTSASSVEPWRSDSSAFSVFALFASWRLICLRIEDRFALASWVEYHSMSRRTATTGGSPVLRGFSSASSVEPWRSHSPAFSVFALFASWRLISLRIEDRFALVCWVAYHSRSRRTATTGW